MSASLSPISPARVPVLLLPVGRVQKTRFRNHVDRLQRETIVRLGDISPDPRSDKTMFSPLAFPNGVIMYQISTTLAPQHHLDWTPFETFRAPMMVLGVADAREEGSSSETIEQLHKDLAEFSKGLKSVLTSYLLLFDTEAAAVRPKDAKNLSFIPLQSYAKSTTIKTIMCDISASFLAELTDLAKRIQDSVVIDTPAALDRNLPLGNSTGTFVLDSAKQRRSRDGQSPTQSPPSEVIASSQADMESAASDSRPSSAGNESILSATLSPPKAPDRPQTNSQSRFSAFRRNSSRDRRSTPVLPATTTERARNKLRARQNVILGTLYLHAGRWTDALRELVDGTMKARAISDHVWHAKGLENILCVMILMAWGGVDFAVPQVCYHAFEKIPNRPRALTGGKDTTEIASDIQEKGLSTLSTLIPDLVKMISDIYPRAVHFQGEALAAVPQAQSNIRLAYLLAVLYRFGGSFTIESVRLLVSGTSKYLPQIQTSANIASSINKQDITSLLFRSYPNWAVENGAPLLDAAIILSSMASVLAFCGLRRKQGLLMREFLSMLMPGLIQARKVGAAEVGIHPAASLAALHGLNNDNNNNFASISSGELEIGFHSVLEHLSSLYGASLSGQVESSSSIDDNSMEGKLRQEAMQTAEIKAFGSPALKRDILKLCSNFSEALPNFKDVIYYAASLLNVTGPSGIRQVYAPLQMARLGREEQFRLSSKITRTLGVVRTADVEKLETQYWDRYLVRDITLSAAPDTELVASHPSESLIMPVVNEDDAPDNLTKPRQASIENVIVAGEKSRLLVTLQNPFEFEVVIERLFVEHEGIRIEQSLQTFVLGPARSQMVAVSVTALSSGTLTIKGCLVKIQGCREQHFPIFRLPWTPDAGSKVKSLGLNSIPTLKSDVPFDRDDVPMEQGPVGEQLKLVVIDQQPLLTTRTDSLSQSTITVLEGQKRTFAITVRNVSASIPVTFVKISFSHPVRESQMSTSKGLLGRTELHELDYLQSHQQPFNSEQSQGSVCNIKPGDSWSFNVDVFGRVGVTGGSVVIDYTQMDLDSPPQGSRIYMRTLSIPFTVTVQPSIVLQRIDVMPLMRPFTGSAHPNEGTNGIKSGGSKGELISFLESAADGSSASAAKSFLLLLDLKNASEDPLSASVLVDPSQQDPEANWICSHSQPYTSTLTIQPSRVVRIVVPVPQVLVIDPQAPLPRLRTLKERQFVVSASGGMSEAEERRTLELFWYRQALLSMVCGTWQTLDGLDLLGGIDLRGIQLNQAMLHYLRLHSLQMTFSLHATESESATRSDQASDTAEEDVTTTTGTFFSLRTTSLHELTTTMTNVSSQPLTFHLVLRPSAAHQNHGLSSGPNAALQAAQDSTPNFAYSGSLQQAFVELAPGASAKHQLGMCVLSNGRYVIEATAHAIQLPGAKAEPNRAKISKDGGGDDESKRTSSTSDQQWAQTEVFGSAQCDLLVVG